MGQIMHDVFGPGSNTNVRIVEDYEELERRVAACKRLNMRVVMTSGTYDLFHEGHARYLERARQHGDILIVGVDDDDKVRARKAKPGKPRPFDSERQRMEILCHVRHVDLVFLKKLTDPKWQLIKTVKPDTLVATQETYTEEQLRQLKEFCGEVVVLPPQASTSTTAKIRNLLIGPFAEVRQKLGEVIGFLDDFSAGAGR